MPCCEKPASGKKRATKATLESTPRQLTKFRQGHSCAVAQADVLLLAPFRSADPGRGFKKIPSLTTDELGSGLPKSMRAPTSRGGR